MSEPSADDLALAAGRAWPLEQVRTLLEWVGEGRALTQTGGARLADARELVGLLGTELPEHQHLWRKVCDRDVRHALGVLERFGALQRDGERVVLTELGS